MDVKLLHQLLTLADPSIFNTASPGAEKIAGIGNGFLVAAAAMTILVLVLTVYIPLRYRARPGQPEPAQTSGNHKLEIAMVGVPLLLVVFFFFWSVKVMSAVMPARGHRRPDLLIVAHQWWWEIHYTGTPVTTANEVHLPVDRPLLIQLNSTDVIHDWWVPAFGAKMDMIPGHPNYLWLTVQKPGIYEGACSVFCGQQHAWMRIRVVAENAGAFSAWLRSQEAPAHAPADSLAQAGAQLFMRSSCSNCHSIHGTIAVGNAGPDLTHYGGRATMLSGMMENSPGHLDQWLSDPQKIKPGAHMPRFIFSRDSIQALVAYLNQLK